MEALTGAYTSDTASFMQAAKMSRSEKAVALTGRGCPAPTSNPIDAYKTKNTTRGGVKKCFWDSTRGANCAPWSFAGKTRPPEEFSTRLLLRIPSTRIKQKTPRKVVQKSPSGIRLAARTARLGRSPGKLVHRKSFLHGSYFESHRHV